MYLGRHEHDIELITLDAQYIFWVADDPQDVDLARFGGCTERDL